MRNKKKPFANSKINKSELRKNICELAKQLGVKRVVYNQNGKKVRGTYNSASEILYIDSKQTKLNILLTFFHELGHHYAVKRKKWLAYHTGTMKDSHPEKIFEIENKIDKISNTLWNKYVSLKQWGKYKYVYPKSRRKLMVALLAEH